MVLCQDTVPETFEVRDIWLLSPLAPSKREKNIQTETIVVFLFLFVVHDTVALSNHCMLKTFRNFQRKK